jgi:hypothetical protein
MPKANLEEPISLDRHQESTLTKPRRLPGQTDAHFGKYESGSAVGSQTEPYKISGSSLHVMKDVLDGIGVSTRRGGQGISQRNFESCYSNSRGGAILELSPENIDVLVAESLREKSEMKQEVGELRNLQPKALNPSSKHIALHYSSSLPSSNSKAIKPSTSAIANPWPTRTPLEERRLADRAREPWQVQKAALKEKFPDGWNPRKRLSPDALVGIRAIHSQFPEQYTTHVLAEKFEVSPEAIRRILKSKWTPKEEEELDRQRRWFSRGQKVWGRYAELGLKPPARWRQLGIGKTQDGAEQRSSSEANITVRSVDYARGTTSTAIRGGSLADRIL